MATIDSVKIRMYRHGFGDCFLLRFYAGAERKMAMLIDCGLKMKDKVEGITMQDVADDIRKLLNEGKPKNAKPRLDVLVATHEHWDHVSGFHPDLALFDDFLIDKIWMAWTESPLDKEAAAIRKHIRKSVKALKLANEKLRKSPSNKPGFYELMMNGETLATARQRFGQALEQVTEFYGPLGTSPLSVTKTKSGITLSDKYKISLDTQKAMDHLKGLAKGEAGIEYYYPGDLIQQKASLPGVRIYVLGPPKNGLLNKDKPSSGARKEVYFGLDNYAMMGFVNGLLAAGDADGEFDDDSQPFNDVVSIPATEAAAQPYFKDSYFKKALSWRGVEEDWLNMSGALAMQLDSDTNNTSLALAIELVDSGKVLLFPGDAQVGNWLSWHEHTWEVKNGNKKETINATQLLNNTVLYKAGHHLSHNATLKALGLELMKSDELVTLIPEKEKQYNGIPFEPLIERISAKTKGRFLFSADSNFPAEDIKKKKPAQLSKAEWEAFKDSLTIDKLFVEYTVKG